MIRILKSIQLWKWIATIAAIIIALAWFITVPITDQFVTILSRTGRTSAFFMKGSFIVEVEDAPTSDKPCFSIIRGSAMQRQVIEPREWAWGIRWPRAIQTHGRQDTFTEIAIPLWLPFIVAVIAAGIMWHRARPKAPDHCGNCGYDLTGNVSRTCSECGTSVSSRSSGPQLICES